MHISARMEYQSLDVLWGKVGNGSTWTSEIDGRQNAREVESSYPSPLFRLDMV